MKSLKEQDRILLTKTSTNYEKTAAENSLFYFGKYILGFNEFDENVHREWEFFLKGPKRLKFVLIPRDHFKSSFFRFTSYMHLYTQV